MKIHEQAKYQKARADFLEEELSTLLHYVSSKKFYEDTTVQTGDIQHRIQETFTTLYREYPE